jgi:nucleoside 2-deoxyribosyltransferase
MSKIYVASSFLNKKEARKAVNKLTRAGATITSRWLAHRPTTNPAQWAHEAIKDVQDVLDSDQVVVIWPGRFGTATEIGMALALNKPVHMIGDVPLDVSVYHNHPAVWHWSTLGEFLEGIDVT